MRLCLKINHSFGRLGNKLLALKVCKIDIEQVFFERLCFLLHYAFHL